MTDIAVATASSHTGGALRVRRLRLILALCLLDVLAPILVVLNYLGIPLMFMVNINQLFIFASIVALTQSFSRKILPVLIPAVVIFAISLLKVFLLTGPGNYNFTISALGPFYFSLFMPFLIFISIMSQNEDDIDVVYGDIYWFSKWYCLIVIPLVLIYAVLHFGGVISYFGLGINFHYFAPFFFQRYSHVLGMAILILLTGKRAVLLNFVLQFLFFFLGQMKRVPIKTALVLVISGIGIVAASGTLSILLRRFYLMYEAFGNTDLSGGLLAIANSYEAIVLFGGRLEEVVGVVEYFSQYPNQIWLGSPPGANFVWFVELTDYETLKSFTHFTWLGYVFRYGLLPTGLLIGLFIYLAIKGANTQNPLWLIYIGLLTSATFGANLFYSPVAWTLIALYVRYGPAISRQMKKGKDITLESSA